MKRPALAILAVAAISCGKDSGVLPGGPIACTAIAVAAVNITVLDDATGLGLSFRDLWARARDGSYMDSTLVPFTFATSAPHQFGLAFERPGTYDITVKAQGYKAWTRSGVVVKADVCHVTPVVLTAYLQK